MVSKIDKDAVIIHLKDIMNSPQPAFTFLSPMDHAIAHGELVRWNAVRSMARDTLMRLHEAGMIDLSEYRDD